MRYVIDTNIIIDHLRGDKTITSFIEEIENKKIKTSIKDFPFHKIWNDKEYKTKQIKPVFVEEKNEIIVVTVYVYYF